MLDTSGKELPFTSFMQVAVSDEEMRSRVEALGRKIRKEDGVANAVAAFQHYLQELEQEV
ncbi:hypothetical protein H6F98_17740 [Microcoleus sp. FACHB-SPT15]|nr:hypothetical protein [Microcoleus sp. FACHB-SPT15]